MTKRKESELDRRVRLFQERLVEIRRVEGELQALKTEHEIATELAFGISPVGTVSLEKIILLIRRVTGA